MSQDTKAISIMIRNQLAVTGKPQEQYTVGSKFSSIPCNSQPAPSLAESSDVEDMLEMNAWALCLTTRVLFWHLTVPMGRKHTFAFIAH